jgi:hypothetical protein
MNAEQPSTPHLSEAQFGELMAAPPKAADSALTPAEVHVLTCEQCAAELASLRESLSLFREASTRFAADQLRQIPPVVFPVRPAVSPVLRSVVLTCAAALVLAAFVPMQVLHQRSREAARRAASANAAPRVEHYATESNEALLDDVDQAASASVPDAMQALANPAAANDLSVQKSN